MPSRPVKVGDLVRIVDDGTIVPAGKHLVGESCTLTRNAGVCSCGCGIDRFEIDIPHPVGPGGWVGLRTAFRLIDFDGDEPAGSLEDVLAPLRETIPTVTEVVETDLSPEEISYIERYLES